MAQHAVNMLVAAITTQKAMTTIAANVFMNSGTRTNIAIAIRITITMKHTKITIQNRSIFMPQ